MNAKWVVNASPLILLAKVHRLGLLVELAQTLVIPESVAAEIKAGPDNDPDGTICPPIAMAESAH